MAPLAAATQRSLAAVTHVAARSRAAARSTFNSCTQRHPVNHTSITVSATSRLSSASSILRSFSTAAGHSEQDSHSDFQPIARQPSAASSSSTSVSDADIDSLSEKDVTQLIERDVSSSPVFLYMKGNPSTPRCGFSANVVRILQMCNVPFSARDVLSSEKLRQGIKQYSDWPTIPQLYVDGEFIGGSDIITNLYKTGELNKMLTKYQKQASQ